MQPYTDAVLGDLMVPSHRCYASVLHCLSLGARVCVRARIDGVCHWQNLEVVSELAKKVRVLIAFYVLCKTYWL